MNPRGTEVLLEQRHSQQGYEADVLVTKAIDGTVTSRAEARDRTNGDDVKLWTDGTTVKWEGTIRGEPAAGSVIATDLLSPGDPPSPYCLHPVAAIVCVGAALVLLGGCAFGFSCDGQTPASGPSNPPESPGGAPSEGGDGDGGGGDGED